MKYRVLKPIRIGGRRVPVGEVVELSQVTGKWLTETGHVERIKEEEVTE